MKIWWQKLSWPDPENGAVVLTKILEDVCSCVITYSNLIREKVQQIFHAQENVTRAFITEQVSFWMETVEAELITWVILLTDILISISPSSPF